MKVRTAALVFSCTAATISVFAESTRENLTPISRVVELLRGLRTQTETELNTDEKLYEKFVCWGKTVISTKTASNTFAKKRINELETYIADIDAGRIEFTSERKDLESEMAAVLASMEEANALRNKEHEEFLDAEDEMVKAKTALETAISVLEEATAGHEQGVLLQKRRTSDEIAARSASAAELMQAVNIGEKVLNHGDATFLKRLLIADVPTVDWNKLNRKATFKLGYKARSFKIQGVLKELHSTMNTSLADARAKEAETKAQFEKLMQSKTQEKTKTQEALDKMEEENGARGMNKEEAQAEVDALNQQVRDDSKYIDETRLSLSEKKTEWVDRKQLRTEEIAAISKAIAILSNDDARDLFTRSLKSQGYSFLQASQKSVARSAALTLSKAVADLKRDGTQRNSGLTELAARLTGVDSTHFTKVIAAIDKMVADLKEEEDMDLEKKENCEKTRLDDTRMVAVTSRNMDERTEEIARLESEIQEINAEIAEKNETIVQIQTQLDEATENREAEKAEFARSAKDDADAKATVERAKDVLSAFYTDNNLMLVQKRAPAAGEAPERPPDTWDSPYMGKTEESTSVIAVLGMIIEDIAKDASDAKIAEDKSAAEYSEFKLESEGQIQKLNETITDLDSTKAGKESERKSAGDTRLLKRDELDVVMKKIADAQPGCDFVTINYPMRLDNRRIEIDGLVKAKAILTGGEFNRPNPHREIRPGDAFLARN
jgi:hypothetical protein